MSSKSRKAKTSEVGIVGNKSVPTVKSVSGSVSAALVDAARGDALVEDEGGREAEETKNGGLAISGSHNSTCSESPPPSPNPLVGSASEVAPQLTHSPCNPQHNDLQPPPATVAGITALQEEAARLADLIRDRRRELEEGNVAATSLSLVVGGRGTELGRVLVEVQSLRGIIQKRDEEIESMHRLYQRDIYELEMKVLGGEGETQRLRSQLDEAVKRLRDCEGQSRQYIQSRLDQLSSAKSLEQKIEAASKLQHRIVHSSIERGSLVDKALAFNVDKYLVSKVEVACGIPLGLSLKAK